MYFFPLIEVLLSIPGSHPGITCFRSKKSDDFWKAPVFMRQILPFVIKGACPFYWGSWFFYLSSAFSILHKLSLLRKSFACLGILWRPYLFLWYCCPRFRKGPSNRCSMENSSREFLAQVSWGLVFSAHSTLIPSEHWRWLYPFTLYLYSAGCLCRGPWSGTRQNRLHCSNVLKPSWYLSLPSHVVSLVSNLTHGFSIPFVSFYKSRYL